MANSTYFVQGCPTCGRRLNIRVEHLGKRVVCQHCHGGLVARDPASLRVHEGEPESEILRRANELLSSMDAPGQRQRGAVPR